MKYIISLFYIYIISNYVNVVKFQDSSILIALLSNDIKITGYIQEWPNNNSKTSPEDFGYGAISIYNKNKEIAFVTPEVGGGCCIGFRKLFSGKIGSSNCYTFGTENGDDQFTTFVFVFVKNKNELAVYKRKYRYMENKKKQPQSGTVYKNSQNFGSEIHYADSMYTVYSKKYSDGLYHSK